MLRRPKLTIGALLVLTVISAVIFTRLPQSFFPPSSTPLFYVNLFRRRARISAIPRALPARSSSTAEQDGVSDVSSFIGAGASRFMLTYMPEQPNASLMHFRAHQMPSGSTDSVRQINQLPQRYPSRTSAPSSCSAPMPRLLEARISARTSRCCARYPPRAQAQEQGQVLNATTGVSRHWCCVRMAPDRLADAGLTRRRGGARTGCRQRGPARQPASATS